MRLVQILWRDSTSELTSWMTVRELEEAVTKDGYLNCRSVGLLVRDDPTSVTVALSEDITSGNVGHPQTIPREAILEIRELKAGRRLNAR